MWDSAPTAVSTRAVNVAAKLFCVSAIVGLLYWAQAIILPIALALLITFVLTPLVVALHRRNWPRVPAVLAVMSSVGVVCGLIFWLVGSQMREFANDLPEYRDTIKQKLSDVRSLMRDGAVEKAQDTLKQVNKELDNEEKQRKLEEKKKKRASEKAKADDDKPFRIRGFVRRLFGEPNETPPGENPLAKAQAAKTAQKVAAKPEAVEADTAEEPEPVPVEVESSGNSISDLLASTSPMLSPLATAGFVAVLVMFMLLQFDDLRNRLVVAVGNERVALTMKALDDATNRISRFLLMQLVVNTTFGLAIGIGLAVLGVPYALLWGLCAAVFRYIPFLGPWIAAALPISISLITSPGWSQVIGVVLLFLVLELLSNNVMEPLLYSQSVGVSEVGILVSAAFWAWLWGPLGLLLSTPITVCLVVIGQHVRPLSVFHKILGNDPLREPAINFFQRTLAGDLYDARKIVEQHLREHSPAETFDDIIQPALSLLRRDHTSGVLDDDDVKRFCQLSETILEEAACAEDSATCPDDGSTESTSAFQPLRKCYGCAANDRIDAVALVAQVTVMRSRGAQIEILDEDLLASEQVTQIEAGSVICVSSIGPDNSAHARYLCKRLLNSVEDPVILLGNWGEWDSNVWEGDSAEGRVFVADRMEALTNRMLAEARTERPARTVDDPFPVSVQ